jgi:hypothetical protein
MSVQYSEAVRNAMLDQLETTVGTGPTLEIRSDAPPTNAAAADTGTLLASIALPSDWLAAASGGAKALLGEWAGAGVTEGTAGHFRIKQSTTTHIQGTVTMPGAEPLGDMVLDNTSIATDQAISISACTFSASGA